MVKNLYREVYLIHQDNLTLQLQVFEVFFVKLHVYHGVNAGKERTKWLKEI